LALFDGIVELWRKIMYVFCTFECRVASHTKVCSSPGSVKAMLQVMFFPVDSDVAGLVLVNPVPEDLFSYDNHIWSEF